MIDGWTISLASALVVVVTAALFIGSTISHKDSEVGRLWAAGYLASILTTVSFLVWLLMPAAWWASAVGNAAFVAGTGLFWVGCRRQNGRSGLYYTVAIAAVVVLVAGLLPGPDPTGWAGARVYFVCNMIFAALAAFESGRGELRRLLGARALVVVFAVEATFFAGRLLFFVLWGPENEAFSLYFGSSATALITMVMMIVLSTSMALIRTLDSGAQAGAQAHPTRHAPAGGLGYTADSVLTEPAFERVVSDWLERAEFHDEQLALLHFDLDDLAEINTAFGRAHGNAVLSRYTAVVRRFSPPHSDIGVAGPGRLVLATPIASPEDALAVAASVQGGLLDESVARFGGVRPTVSVGIALSDYTGYDFKRLNGEARAACARASRAGGNRSALAHIGA